MCGMFTSPSNKSRILVTGGGTFLGDSIAAALLAEGAEVTLLVRPGAEENLGPLAQRTRWFHADIWNPASLRGRARGHTAVIHTVGSLTADLSQGLNHHWLNFVSARNVANMCVSAGVPQMVLMSSVRAPWVSSAYIAAKREAEAYMSRVGLNATIIRAPVAYVRGSRRTFPLRLMTFFGSIPVFNWIFFSHASPMPVDVLARGVARITLEPNRTRSIYYAPDLRHRNDAREIRGAAPLIPGKDPQQAIVVPRPFDLLDENTPFGWTPPTDRD